MGRFEWIKKVLVLDSGAIQMVRPENLIIPEVNVLKQFGRN